MSSLPPWSSKKPGDKLLHQGDCMEQPRFHRLYAQMDEDYRAELVGGVVCEPSPLGYEHAASDLELGCILRYYAGNTPGVTAAHGATVILGGLDEVQPDLLLRIEPESGGQSKNVRIKERTSKNTCLYVGGAPELMAEIAHSSADIDLRQKKARYALAGVVEYIVVCVEPRKLYWFKLSGRCDLPAGSDSIYRSQVFPGLWIDSQALLNLDFKRNMDVLAQGLQSPEHAQFATVLSSR